jgi:hypothetical protein
MQGYKHYRFLMDTSGSQSIVSIIKFAAQLTPDSFKKHMLILSLNDVFSGHECNTCLMQVLLTRALTETPV